MGLFNWLRSKRSPHRPPSLPVRYGLGPPPPKTPGELCPLCGSEIVEVRCVAHSVEFGSVERGRCSACDTTLARGPSSNDPLAWHARVPAPEQLLAVVTRQELEALTARIGRLVFYDRDWAEFLGSRRSGDEVWRFASENGREGFAVVRQGRPLTQFLPPEPDLEQMILAHAERQAARDRCAGRAPPALTALLPAWRTSTVLELARVIHESQDFSAMPILADALEDRGCDNTEILEHCRGSERHVRGCWVVRLVLGNE